MNIFTILHYKSGGNAQYTAQRVMFSQKYFVKNLEISYTDKTKKEISFIAKQYNEFCKYTVSLLNNFDEVYIYTTDDFLYFEYGTGQIKGNGKIKINNHLDRILIDSLSSITLKTAGFCISCQQKKN